MNNGTIVQSIIIILSALYGTYLFVQTYPIYVMVFLALGISIAALIPAAIFHLNIDWLYSWWYYDRDYDEAG